MNQISAPEVIERRKDAHPCQEHTNRLTTMELTHTHIKESMSQVSAKLDLILAKVNRVEILEERHTTQQLDINRAHDKVKNVEIKHEDFAKEVRDFISYTKGMARMAWIVWSGLGVVVIAVAVKVFFFSVQLGMTP